MQFIKIIGCVLCCCLFSAAFSQTSIEGVEVLKGKITDKTNGTVIKNVHIVNLTKQIGTISNLKGNFTIQATSKDSIHISIIGYQPIRNIAFNLINEEGFADIQLARKVYELKEISIYNVPSPEEFKDAFLELEVPKYYAEIELPKIPKQRAIQFNEETKMPTYTIKGPITALYQKFNKHQRMLAEAQNRLDKYAAYNKYLSHLAQSVTGYEKKQDIQEFLHFCNIEVTYIREYNDYDLTQALEFCFVEYNN